MSGRAGRRWRVLVVVAAVGLLLLLWDQQAVSAAAVYAERPSHPPFAVAVGHGAHPTLGAVPYRHKATASHAPLAVGEGADAAAAVFAVTLMFFGVVLGAYRRPRAATRALPWVARAPPASAA